MAERNTVISYAFEGDTLSLQQAIKQVNNLLESSIEELKKYQKGALTETQQEQVVTIRKRLQTMQDLAKKERSLSEENKQRVRRAGAYALAQSKNLSRQVAKVKESAAKEEQRVEAEKEAKRLEVAELTTTAIQENTKQHADYLENYADRFAHTISKPAYDQIKLAVEAFRTAKDSMDGTEESTERLAEATANLKDTYKAYAETLQAASRAQQQASRSIRSLGDFIAEAGRQIKITVKTFSFWLKVIKLLYKAIQDYVNLVKTISDAKFVDDKQLESIKQAAEVWQRFNRQLKLFMTNIGATLMNVLAPMIKIFSIVLMLVNALLSAFSGVAKLAESASDMQKASGGGGLTSLDEINQSGEKGGINELGDDVDNLVGGMDDLAERLAGIFELFKLLGSIVGPILGGIQEGLFLIIDGIVFLIDGLFKVITWFLKLFGITSDWNKEGSVMGEVLRYLGVLLSGVVALGMALLIKNMTVAIAKMVIMTAKTLLGAAAAIKQAIANIFLNGTLLAKIGLLTLGAGLGIAAVVLAATGAFSSKSKSDIPAMARGGVVSSPTMALIGEGQFNEAVVPLGNSPQFRVMKQEIAQAVLNRTTQTPAAAAQRNIPVNNQPVVLNIDGREIARAIAPAFDSTRHQTSVRLRTT